MNLLYNRLRGINQHGKKEKKPSVTYRTTLLVDLDNFLITDRPMN
jgi:hypothetical protein